MYRPKIVEPEGVLDYFSRETGIWLYGYPIVIKWLLSGELVKLADQDTFEFSDPSGGDGITAEDAVGEWALEGPEKDTDPIEGDVTFVRKFDQLMSVPKSLWGSSTAILPLGESPTVLDFVLD
jgi:hypothetical protein